MIFGLHVIASAAQEPERIHTVAFFPSASDAFRDGLARVINHSGDAGEVRMDVFDDEGESYGPVVLALDAGAVVHFTSDDLESGNAAKGLPGAIGPGEGDWRLELSSELDIEVLSYVRTGDGFLTAMHDTAPSEGGRHRIAFFNPASNASQVSRLRLVNPSEDAAEVSIVGVDDRGESPGSEVTTTIAAGASRTFTAAELESGGEGLQGALGDGEGKWRLVVESAQPIVAMSLLSDPTGHLTNLSTAPGRKSQGPADLVVVSPSVSNDRPVAGATFTLSATVSNTGDGDSAATMLRYYQSADATITTSDAEVGTDAVAGLAASASSDESVELTAPSMAGPVYYYGACVDAVAGESDTANNCSTAVRETVREPTRIPDLVFDTPTVSESEPDAAAEFTLSVTVRNRGGGDAGATTLRYYRSADTAITTADAEVAVSILDGGLEESASSEERVWLRAPSDPGAYYYGACVDAVDDESDTANNCSSSVRVTVPEPTTFPDLVVDTPTVSESAPDAGAPFTLSATVRNRGDADAGATTLRYYRSADATITTADTVVGTDAVGGLAASGAGDESARLSAPSDPGAYYYGACVDAVDGESNTSNNCSAVVRVTVPEPAGDPDLVVDAPPLGDGNAGGGEFTLSATVRNRGGRAAAAATSLVYYRSRDAHISTEDLELFSAGVPGLAALGTSAYSELVRVPWNPGAHYFGACVDAVPGESDTTNNCSAATVLLQPDLRADSVSADRWLDKGEEFGLYAVVRNTGTAASASTRRRYYHSEDQAISTSDTEVATEGVSRMPPTGLNGWLVYLNAPSDPGIHYYGACIDAVPGESDTTNNCSEGYRVQVFGEPDLVVREPSVSESNLEPGMEFTLSVTVRNQGDADSLSQPTLRFYRSVGTRISTSDIEVGTSWVGVLRVSASHDRSLTLNAPSDPGTYYFYGACVDAVSNESNTRNNCSSAVRVTVSDP